jgi:hypothetical protein
LYERGKLRGKRGWMRSLPKLFASEHSEVEPDVMRVLALEY